MVKSAFMGQVPASEHDYWIIKGMYRAAYHFAADPSRGYTLMPSQPEGYRYNDKRGGIVAGMIIAMVIMMFFTVTRLSLRFFRAGLMSGADDYMLIPGACLAFVYPVLQLVMVTQGGGGKHVWDVTYDEYNLFNKYGVICKILFFTSVGVIKLSIALFLRRMSSGSSSKGWRIANDFLILLLVSYTLLALFWTCFQCNPPPAMWDKVYSGKLPLPARCWSTPLLGTVLSVIHVVMDFILLTIPIIILWSVNLKRAKKIRLYLVFSIGALSCVCSVFRELAQQNIDRDITYGYTTLLAWTVVDLTLAVVVASLPVLSALVPALVRELTESSGIFGTIRPSAGTNRMTTSGAVSTDRQASHDSEEGGILCEHEIELSYSMDQTKSILESGSYITTQTNGIYIDRKHGNDSGLVV